MALANARQNRSSITIAHRLSTIKNVDLIYVMHDGRIVEKGTPNELLAMRGFYFKLTTRKELGT